MTSTYCTERTVIKFASGMALAGSNGPANESETEDEEVRMNCIGGFRGVDDSDMYTSGNSECDDCMQSDDEESVDRYVLDVFSVARFQRFAH